MSVSTITKGVRHFLYQNAPQILSGFACGGVVATSIFAGKGAVKLEKENITFKRFKEAPKSEKKQLVKKTGKILAPAIASGTATIGCVIMAQRINSKRLALMAGVYTMTKEAFELYKTKTKDIVGEKQEQKIREAIAQEKCDKKPLDNQIQKVIVFGNMDGKIPVRDSISGRDFLSDYETIRGVINDLNCRIRHDGWVSLNDFYDELGLENTKQGDEMGWLMDHDSITDQIAVDYDAAFDLRTKQPIVVLNYDVVPRCKSEFPFY